MDFLDDLHQLKYPREFRITKPTWPREGLGDLSALIRATSLPRSSASGDKAQEMLLVDMATRLWRMKQKMIQPDTQRPSDEMRRAFREFESAWDSLSQAGVEIQEHTGEPIPKGGTIGLRILAYQPTPGITNERVIETVKPSVFVRGQRVQMGEVIVGTPMADE